MAKQVKVTEYFRDKPRYISLTKTRFQMFVWKVKQLFRRLMLGSAVATLLYGVFFAGGQLNTQYVYATKVEEKIVEVESPAPVLERIAKCESGGSHYTKDGQVVLGANKNGTVDIGKYQINTIWAAQATKLGLDLTKEEDNYKFALWIYKNKGTGDWYSSEKCWKR